MLVAIVLHIFKGASRAVFVGDVSMKKKKLFECPPNGWISKSGEDPDSLSLVFYKRANEFGLHPNEMFNIVQIDGVQFVFRERNVGCTVEVLITSPAIKVAFEKNLRLQFLWKYFVDQGVVFGGPYSRDLSALQAETSKAVNEKASKTVKKKSPYPRIPEDRLKEVDERSLAGQSITEISIAMNLSKGQVKSDRQRLKAQRDAKND
jgi:hypothetical protein